MIIRRRLALDESLTGEGEVERWLEVGWPGVFIVKPSLLGDAAGALARLAAAKGRTWFFPRRWRRQWARGRPFRLAFQWPGEARALGFGVCRFFPMHGSTGRPSRFARPLKRQPQGRPRAHCRLQRRRKNHVRFRRRQPGQRARRIAQQRRLHDEHARPSDREPSLHLAIAHERFIEREWRRIIIRQSAQQIFRAARVRRDRLFDKFHRTIGATFQPVFRLQSLPCAIGVEPELRAARQRRTHVIEQRQLVGRVAHAHFPFEGAKARLGQRCDFFKRRQSRRQKRSDWQVLLRHRGLPPSGAAFALVAAGGAAGTAGPARTCSAVTRSPRTEHAAATSSAVSVPNHGSTATSP